MATIFTVPFMNCLARVPLYTLLLGVFFVEDKSLMMFYISTMTIIFALLVAKLLTKTVLSGHETSPFAKDLLLGYRFGETDLFYSPVIERFVYKELIGEGHQFIYRDQNGNDYDRRTFETLIPFIYYKNMELWGLLPLQLDGQRFDKAAIQADRDPGRAPGLRAPPRRAARARPQDPALPAAGVQSRSFTAALPGGHHAPG